MKQFIFRSCKYLVGTNQTLHCLFEKMADNANGEEESIETDQRDFGLTLLELMEIMQARGEEGRSKIDKVGGVEGVLHKLRSNQRTGLRDAELELRREVFGSNRLPKSYQKTFLSLCWEALIHFFFFIRK